MAHDVAEMITTVAAESHWPDEQTAILRHIVRALRHFRHERFYFSEASASLTCVAGQSVYERGSNADDLPPDLLELDSLRVESGSGELIVEKASFDLIRRYQAGSQTSRDKPEIFAFHQDKLHIWPTPGSAWVLNFDYLKDATRDTLTGNEITIDSPTTYTNEFFTRAEELLCNRVLYSLALGRAEDAKAALTAKTAYDDALQSLRAETNLRKVGSTFVSDAYFG